MLLLQWRPLSPDGNGPLIRTSLTIRETEALRDLARGKSVMEIGAAFGYSTVAMGQVAARVVSIDPHDSPLNSREEWSRNVSRYGVSDRVVGIHDLSYVVIPRICETFDGAFIDGDHSEASVQQDIELVLPLIRPGGFIACHDYDEETCPGVRPPCDRLIPGGELVDTLYVRYMV